MIVFKLLGGDAVDDVKVLVDLGNPDVVPDDHRVRVQWRLPLDVRVGDGVVALAVGLGRLLMGFQFSGNVVGCWFHQSFDLKSRELE